MSKKHVINIAKDFSDTPGAREDEDGDFSGEAFLEKLLLPKFEAALKDGEKLTILLDEGIYGYPSSFVSASFGALSNLKGKDVVLDNLELVSTNPIKIEKITNQIENPESKTS